MQHTLADQAVRLAPVANHKATMGRIFKTTAIFVDTQHPMCRILRLGCWGLVGCRGGRKELVEVYFGSDFGSPAGVASPSPGSVYLARFRAQLPGNLSGRLWPSVGFYVRRCSYTVKRRTSNHGALPGHQSPSLAGNAIAHAVHGPGGSWCGPTAP